MGDSSGISTKKTASSQSDEIKEDLPGATANKENTSDRHFQDNKAADQPSIKVDSGGSLEGTKIVKKNHITWERAIEVAKLVATIWVALVGSFVTMQFNDRQHELNRIEAIAQMLPHMSGQGAATKSDEASSTPGKGDDMGRDGAIWAIFRTANNRTMLRDLASLFPEDIYRVVSSIAISGELDRDPDATVALRVSSEKLAAQYSTEPKHTELASRLYTQALRLRERKPDDVTPLRVVDLATVQQSDSHPTGDQLQNLIKTVNDLGDVHMRDIASPSTKKKSTDVHWAAKELYKRGRNLGLKSTDREVMEQVARSDLSLANLYVIEKLSDDAFKYLKEAVDLEAKITGKPVHNEILKQLDDDGDGYAGLAEIAKAITLAEARLKKIFEEMPDRGAELNAGKEPE